MLIAFFTGGAAAVAKVVKSYTNFFTTVGKAIGKTAKQGYKAIKNIFECLQAQLDELFEAIKNNNLGEWLNKKLDEFFGEEKGDEVIDIATSRATILAKWIYKFEIFYKHFDGEIIIRSKKSKESIEINGAHNYLQNGKKINITFVRKPPGVKLDDIPDDVPFIANVEFKYANRYVQKKNTSSFFPKNWDQIRVEEEIALVYDKMNKSGFELNFAHNKYRTLNSEGTFEILIEIKKNGQISSAYPYISL